MEKEGGVHLYTSDPVTDCTTTTDKQIKELQLEKKEMYAVWELNVLTLIKMKTNTILNQLPMALLIFPQCNGMSLYICMGTLEVLYSTM